jgi:CheY-like chemotaxis protein
VAGRRVVVVHAEMNLMRSTETIIVLVVDDDPDDALVIKRALEALGAPREIYVVSDGQEAWDYLRHQGMFLDVPRPDVILLDLNMPRMDGRELLALIKSDESLKAIPTIVFTRSSAQEDLDTSYHRHANAYVTKPVDPDDLMQVVSHIDQFFTGVALLPNGRHAS